jgi:hypothetical protein
MKKILALLLAAIMVLSVFTLAACNDEPGPNNQGNNSCTSHVDANTDYKCDNCGAELEKPACTEHEDADKNGKCDKCDAEVEEELTEDEQAAKDVIDRIEKIQEFTKKNYSKQKTNIDRARRDYDKLTDAQKALIPAEMLEKLTNAEALYAAYKAADEKAEALVVNKIVTETPTVDGVINVEYYMGASLTVTTEAGTKVTFRFLLDSKEEYIYIVEERKDATANWATDFNAPQSGDSAVIYFAKDAEQVSGLIWNATTAKSADPVIALFGAAADMGSAATKAYESMVVKAKDGKSYVMEAKIALADLGLTQKDFKDELVGVTFKAYDATGSAVTEMKYAGVDAWDDCQRFFTGKSVDFNFIAEGTPTIDGKLDDIYLQASVIELSQAVCNTFTAEQAANGAKIVGDTTLADSDLMHSTFRFVIDDEYLYIAEHRYDLIPVYETLSFKQPYTADGSLLWFTMGNNATVGIDWNRATKDSSKPIFGLFFNDQQGTATQQNWEYAIRNGGSEYEYVIECKVPLSDLKLTKNDFLAAKVGFTFCTVDVVNPEYDPANFGWTGNAYQMQYIGVGSWGASPILMVNPNGYENGWLPDIGEHDPAYDLPAKEDEIKPFDKVPRDPATGFLTTQYRYTQYANWYAGMKKAEYIFTKDPQDDLPIELVDTANRNNSVGKYTDDQRQFVFKVDLKQYKNAIIVLEVAQNYDIRVSTDTAIDNLTAEQMHDFEGWTKVQDYVEVNGERNKSGNLHHAVAIEASEFAGDADYLYVRLGNCGNAGSHGGSCYNIAIYYEE